MNRIKALEKGKHSLASRLGILTFQLLILLGSVGFMLVYASQKTIEISDTQPGIENEGSEALAGCEISPLILSNDEAEEGRFMIPLGEEIAADTVIVENRYAHRELWITIKKADAVYYQNPEVRGNITPVKGGELERRSDGLTLKIRTDGVYEYKTTLNNGVLTVVFQRPAELYRTIVVVDTTGDTMEQEQIVQGVGRKLSQQFSHEGIKLYFTDLSDSEVTDDMIVRLVKDVEADFFIALDAERATGEQYGISGYYNDVYYISGYGNIEVADALARNITISSRNKARGLFPSGQDDILSRLQVPSARVSLGTVNHATEGILLYREEYQEKLAEGLGNAIMEMHEAIHQNIE
ncbi:MAG: N-acetylmuramoyl-L-alanine amidase [Lachnospiraceae bacterium]|nr:N-acetylmuramoyl-L-alanine amidase [Lachnospiraceae bacterium]